jgi:hypothetical protein
LNMLQFNLKNKRARVHPMKWCEHTTTRTQIFWNIFWLFRLQNGGQQGGKFTS